MNKPLALMAAAFLAAPAFAAPAPESAPASAEKSFQSLSALKLSFQKGAKVEGALPGKIVAEPSQEKTSRTVHISGYATFTGSGSVYHVPGYASLDFASHVNLCDSSGQVCTGTTTLTTMAALFVNNNFVSDWLRPNISVSFYKAGRYVGNAQLSGQIPVSGWVSGNWANLSGSGYLTGDVFLAQ